MSLSFGQLLSILSAMHDDVAPKVVQARLKYFQQLEPPFPSSAHLRDERNARASYPTADLMMLVLAIELLATGIPPLQSATLVRSAWKEAASALAFLWEGGAEGRGAFALAIPDGLEARRAAGGRLEIGGEEALRSWWSTDLIGARRLTIVDLGKVVASLRSAVHATQVPDQARAIRELIGRWSNEHARIALASHRE